MNQRCCERINEHGSKLFSEHSEVVNDFDDDDNKDDGNTGENIHDDAASFLTTFVEDFEVFVIFEGNEQ